jgi:hypothetical protein
MIRTLALALAAFGLAAAAAAQAPATSTWTSPDGLIQFSPKASWEAKVKPGPNFVDYWFGTGAEDCTLRVLKRTEEAMQKAINVHKSYGAQLTSEQWTSMAQGISAFYSPPAAPTASAVETVGGWSINTAEFKADDGPVFAAIHGRPGVEVRAFCAAYDSKDRAAFLKQAVRSVASPKDAEYAAEIAPPAPAAPTN